MAKGDSSAYPEGSKVQLIGQALFDQVARGASASARKRLNHNFHSGPSDNPHRFLNILLKGTYVRPHRHLYPPKAETFLVLQGRAGVLLFDDEGKIIGSHELAGDLRGGMGSDLGIDLGPGIWHTIVALSDQVVCFEVKPGPWEPASDKEFASWAPCEGEAAAPSYLESWSQEFTLAGESAR